MIVTFTIIEVAITEAVFCQRFQFCLSRFKNTPGKITEFLVVAFQTKHLSKVYGLDDGAAFVEPTLNKHVNALGIPVFAGKHNLLAQTMIAQVKRYQSLRNGTVNLQHSIFLIDTLILRNIYIAKVRNLLIMSAVGCLIRNLHRNCCQHFQALA